MDQHRRRTLARDATEEDRDAVDDDAAGLDAIFASVGHARPDNILAPCRCPARTRSSSPTQGARAGRAGRRTGLAEELGRIPKRDPAWRRPSRRRVLAIRDAARDVRTSVNEPHGHPIAELVYERSSPRTPTTRTAMSPWAHARPLPELGTGARRSPASSRRRCARGLAPSKTPRIQSVLASIGDPPDLDWLAGRPGKAHLDYLTDLPGVGRKTAACVLIFTFDRPEIPVDTHVHWVGGGWACSAPRAGFDEAHDEMLAITPPEDAYELTST